MNNVNAYQCIEGDKFQHKDTGEIIEVQIHEEEGDCYSYFVNLSTNECSSVIDMKNYIQIE